MVVIALHEIFVQEPEIDEVGINYLISGHSYNENDTAHSVIESAFRKNTLYTMAQWETAIQMAFKKSPAEVNVLTHRDIVDFQNPDAFPEYSDVLSDKVYENNNSSLKKESKIYWSKLMRIKFSKQNPDQMFFKYHYGDCEWKHTTLFKPPKTRKSNKRIMEKQR